MKLDFVVFREEGVWIAHGLQHSVLAQGESLAEIRKNIALLLKAYEQRSPGSVCRLPAASAQYWEMFVDALDEGRDMPTDVPDDSVDAYSFRLKAA